MGVTGIDGVIRFVEAEGRSAGLRGARLQNLSFAFVALVNGMEWNGTNGTGHDRWVGTFLLCIYSNGDGSLEGREYACENTIGMTQHTGGDVFAVQHVGEGVIFHLIPRYMQS